MKVGQCKWVWHIGMGEAKSAKKSSNDKRYLKTIIEEPL
jgi:hypothetical protein